MVTRRKIIKIDEEKCDGCGLCVPACAEGAIQIIDGKARLVSEVYCDGLGDCLGECPQDAINIEEREAEEFDPEAVQRHLADRTGDRTTDKTQPPAKPDSHTCKCPGAISQALHPGRPAPSSDTDAAKTETGAISSLLGNWPVQIHLVPVRAPYFQGSRLLIAADCVPFAFADFHRKFLDGRILLIGCPKLDDVDLYRSKLARIFLENDIQAVDVLYMEVPCCSGLVHLVHQALDESGRKIPVTIIKVGIRGDICETTNLQD